MTAPATPALSRPDRTYAGYVLDLDGTVYLGEAALPGAVAALARLRARGARTVFLSNNPTRDPRDYADKLTRLGIPTPVADVVTPLVTLPRWLQQHHPDAGVFVIGEEPLRRALAGAGVRLTERAEDTDVVVASFDRTFDYRKLQTAFDALWYLRRAVLVTTNPDRFCPMPEGRGEPDAAAVVAAIEACTGVRCTANLGKPGAEMLQTVLATTGLPAADCVMVGDRLGTDIAMAVRAGMDSALVLTGETTPAMLAATTSADPAAGGPTWVVPGLGELLPEAADA